MRERILAGVFALVLVGSALAIGSVHVATSLVVAIFALAGAALAATLYVPTSYRALLVSPLGICLALSLYTLFQVIPVPLGALRFMAPSNADVWTRVLLPLSEPGPRWASISLDPGATWLEVLKSLTYASVFAVAMVLCRSRGPAWGAALVFVSGLCVALTTILHGLLGATEVYGLYAPHSPVAAWHVGPLLNPNNLAGYLNLAAMCGVGLMLSRRTFGPRWLVGLGVATLIAVEVTSASRGGFLALPIGLVVLAFLVRGSAGSTRGTVPLSGRGMLLLVGAVVAGGAIWALLGGTQATWDELYDKNLLKVRMLAWALPLIRAHPWFGIGRGSFESVFPAYRTLPGHVVFTHAENFPAQWISEWGLPVGTLALLGFAWFLRPNAIGLRKSTLVASVATGVGVLLLQNLFDLGLEITSVSIALTSVVGSLWGGVVRGREGRSADRSAMVPLGWRWVPGGIVALAATVLVLAYRPFNVLSDVQTERERIQALLDGTANHSSLSEEAVKDQVRVAMLRHPAEPYFPLAVATLAMRNRDRSPMPAFERAFERSSVNGRAHLLLGELLLEQKRLPQARLELRMAATDDPDLAPYVAPLSVRSSSSIDELKETVPQGEEGVSMLTQLARVVREDQRLAILRETLERDRRNVTARAQLAWFYVDQIRQGDQSAICREDRATCEREFEINAAALERLNPEMSEADRYRAEVLMLTGRAEQAEAMIAARCKKVQDPLPCQLQRSRVAAAIKDLEPLRRALQDLVRLGCGPENQCASTATTAGDLLAGRGEWGAALTYYLRASRLEPTEAGWLKVVEAASRVGAHAQAVEALEMVARLRGGDDPVLRARIQEERNRSVAPLMQ